MMSEAPDAHRFSATSASNPIRHEDETPPPDPPGDTIDEHTPLAPPPPPAIDPFSPTVLGGSSNITAAEKRLWLFLQHETYRQRGEGFRPDWAFHLYAAQKDLGAPLARSVAANQYILSGGRSYGFQVFAGDTIFSEIPQWREVQSLNTLLDRTIPASGFARQALETSYTVAGGTSLHDTWRFHQVAVRERIGPPLSESYRITVEGQEYSIQVFARDTLYSQVTHWSDVRRLSETPPGPLFHALWTETCKPCGSHYDAQSLFQQLAAGEKLGTPLTRVYSADFEGIMYHLQVFAADTLYARSGSAPARQSMLAKPETLAAIAFSEVAVTPPVAEAADDALGAQHVTFGLLPIAGRPRISQFFGYTKWAAQQRWNLYSATQGRHSGLDFAVPVGTPLLSIGYGLVVWSGQNRSGTSFGAGPRSIIVRYGDIYAIYGHVSSESVRKGQFVYPGQEIGRSGWPAGPHLHFEVRPVPEPVLRNRDPNQNPQNPGFPINPLEIFAQSWMEYFEQCYTSLGGEAHFCVGSLLDQPGIRFGQAVDQRPCTN